MGFSLAALVRSKGIAGERRGGATGIQGVYTTVADLVSLEASARDFSFLHKQPINRLLGGRHASRTRGRGLDFEELRE